MSGIKESLLEKITKPIRINPIMFLSSSFFFGLGYLLVHKPTNIHAYGMGSLCLSFYLITLASYCIDKKRIKKQGFNEWFGATQMEAYCDRQALYVASVEKGYRNEVNAFMQHTPQEKKCLSFIPHI